VSPPDEVSGLQKTPASCLTAPNPQSEASGTLANNGETSVADEATGLQTLRDAWPNGRLSGLFHSGVVFAITIWAAVLYHPWAWRPQPLIDMPGLLTIASTQPTLTTRSRALIRHQLSEGRFSPLTMTWIAAQYSWFRTEGGGWVWTRFVLMLAVSVAAYFLMLRLGLPPLGAAAGSTLFVIADAARGAWQMPQVVEPVGVLFLFLAVGCAISDAPVSMRSAGAAIATALAVFVKEPFLACVPAVLLLLLWPREQAAFRGLGGKSVLAGAQYLGLLIIVAGVPILWAQAQRDPGGYATRYALTNLSLAATLNAWRASVLPVTRVLLFPANLAFLMIIAGGVLIGWRGSGASRTILVAVALTAGVALMYSPWPAFPGYYALPALIGPATVLGGSFGEVLTHRPLIRWSAIAAFLVLCGYGTLLAINEHGAYSASTKLDRRVALLLGQRGAGRSLVVVTRAGPEAGFARSLELYANLLGKASPKAEADIGCEQAARVVGREASDTAFVFLQSCPGMPTENALTLTEEYLSRDWKTLRRREHRLSVTVWPASALRPSATTRTPVMDEGP
jgi:hypothetical protein